MMEGKEVGLKVSTCEWKEAVWKGAGKEMRRNEVGVSNMSNRPFISKP